MQVRNFIYLYIYKISLDGLLTANLLTHVCYGFINETNLSVKFPTQLFISDTSGIRCGDFRITLIMSQNQKGHTLLKLHDI